jgi:hypothetical protein
MTTERANFLQNNEMPNERTRYHENAAANHLNLELKSIVFFRCRRETQNRNKKAIHSLEN